MLPAETCTLEKQEACSGEGAALARDHTKGAIDTGNFTLTVSGGEQALI